MHNYSLTVVWRAGPLDVTFIWLVAATVSSSSPQSNLISVSLLIPRPNYSAIKTVSHTYGSKYLTVPQSDTPHWLHLTQAPVASTA